jgi:ATP-dependent protease ClpP protease subunit
MKLLTFAAFLLATFFSAAHAEDEPYTNGCKVVFMGSIDVDSMKELLTEIGERKQCGKLDRSLELILQSDGGTVEPAIMVSEAIKDRLCTTVHQSASSAAVLLVVVGKKGCRSMHRDGFLMVHPIIFPEEEEERISGEDSTAGRLTPEQIGVKKRVIERYVSIISKRSLLTEIEVADMMKKVTFLSAQQALRMGLIDIIID